MERRELLIGSAAALTASLFPQIAKSSPATFFSLFGRREMLMLVRYFAREAFRESIQDLLLGFTEEQFGIGFSDRMSSREWDFHRQFACNYRFPSNLAPTDRSSGRYSAAIDEYLCSAERGNPALGTDWNGPELARAKELREAGKFEFFPWPSSIRRRPSNADWTYLRDYARFQKYEELIGWLARDEVDFHYARDFRTGPFRAASQHLLGCAISVPGDTAFLLTKRSSLWHFWPGR